MKTKGMDVQRPAIGLVLEGITQYNAIPLLLQRLGVRTVAPSVFNGQPVDAPIRSLVENRLIRHVRTQLVKANGTVLVILDREARPQSASEFGKKVLAEVIRQVKPKISEAGRIFDRIGRSRGAWQGGGIALCASWWHSKGGSDWEGSRICLGPATK